MILRRLAAALLVALFALSSGIVVAQAESLKQGEASLKSINWDNLDSGNCLVARDKFGFTACPKGDLTGTIRVALIGDSHMRQYFEPLDYLAYKYHWHITYISKSACPVADAKLLPVGVGNTSCRDWNSRLTTYLADNQPFDLIVNSNSTLVVHNNTHVADAFSKVVFSQTARGTIWLTIKDNPKPLEGFATCIQKYPASVAAVKCARPRAAALTPLDLLAPAIQGKPNVVVADFTNAFCNTMCSPIIQGTQVYRDNSHITSSWAHKLVGHLENAIPEKFKANPTPVTQ